MTFIGKQEGDLIDTVDIPVFRQECLDFRARGASEIEAVLKMSA